MFHIIPFISPRADSGVWTRLKEDNPSLITNHCKDPRLALACRDSNKSIKTMKKLDDMLDNLHKYYKYI